MKKQGELKPMTKKETQVYFQSNGLYSLLEVNFIDTFSKTKPEKEALKRIKAKWKAGTANPSFREKKRFLSEHRSMKALKQKRKRLKKSFKDLEKEFSV